VVSDRLSGFHSTKLAVLGNLDHLLARRSERLKWPLFGHHRSQLMADDLELDDFAAWDDAEFAANVLSRIAHGE